LKRLQILQKDLRIYEPKKGESMIEPKETYVKNSESVINELKRGYSINFSYIVLDSYLELPKSCKEEFEMWIENVPFFIDFLWQFRELNYIERFNKVAFETAVKLSIFNNEKCQDLVCAFQACATWKDDPSGFGLSEENLVWLKDQTNFQTIFSWIKASPFLMESDFIKFKKINNIKW